MHIINKIFSWISYGTRVILNYYTQLIFGQKFQDLKTEPGFQVDAR